MAETKTYHGSCHCGNISFTAKLPDLHSLKVVRCNCSICTKNGYLLVYPKIKDFAITSGANELSEYRMASKTRPHNFCGRCGTSIFIDLSQADNPKELQGVVALNLRTFDGIEDVLNELEYKDVDGKHLI